jgi:hypothetical protein
LPTTASVTGFLLLLGLGFFFGLAFEEFNAQGGQARPGGVRSFPLLALAGALLYRLDTSHLLPLTAGLLVLGTHRHHRDADCDPGRLGEGDRPERGSPATIGGISRRSIPKESPMSG